MQLLTELCCMEAQVHSNKPKPQIWLTQATWQPNDVLPQHGRCNRCFTAQSASARNLKGIFFPLQKSLMFQHWYKLAIFGRLALNKPACLHQCMEKQPERCSVLHRPSDDVKHLNFCVRICTVSITTTILQQTDSCKTSTKCNFPLPTVISWKSLTFFNNFLN